MIVTFTPAEGETRSYDFEPARLMSVEAEHVEKKTGKPYEQAVGDIVAGSALARRALLWVLEKRTHPTLAWEGFDYPYGAVEISFDKTELDELIDGVTKAPGMADEDRAAALAQLQRLRESAPESPKAPGPSAETATA